MSSDAEIVGEGIHTALRGGELLAPCVVAAARARFLFGLLRRTPR